jgi:hypothetical protein
MIALPINSKIRPLYKWKSTTIVNKWIAAPWFREHKFNCAESGTEKTRIGKVTFLVDTRLLLAHNQLHEIKTPPVLTTGNCCNG